jgi:beta-galactosidase
LNGKDIGTMATVDGMASFDVPFVNGQNGLTATAGNGGVTISDHADIRFTLLLQDLQNSAVPFTEMNISLGDKRFSFDEKTGQTWIPEQEYKPGSWGYTGGQVFTVRGSTRTGYGTTRHIIGTELDPVYQTQRTGIQQFRMDVPDGKYEVTLLFAELLSPARAGELAYNLSGNAAPPEEFKERSFNVLVNGKELISGLSYMEALEPLHAITSKHTVMVSNKEGILIDFKPIKGEAILNGIQVKRVY